MLKKGKNVFFQLQVSNKCDEKMNQQKKRKKKREKSDETGCGTITMEGLNLPVKNMRIYGFHTIKFVKYIYT